MSFQGEGGESLPACAGGSRSGSSTGWKDSTCKERRFRNRMHSDNDDGTAVRAPRRRRVLYSSSRDREKSRWYWLEGAREEDFPKGVRTTTLEGARMVVIHIGCGGIRLRIIHCEHESGIEDGAFVEDWRTHIGPASCRQLTKEDSGLLQSGSRPTAKYGIRKSHMDGEKLGKEWVSIHYSGGVLEILFAANIVLIDIQQAKYKWKTKACTSPGIPRVGRKLSQEGDVTKRDTRKNF